MRIYSDLIQHILINGIDRPDRTGKGTRAVFGYQMRFDLAQGFPILTTKRVHFKSVVGELLWMLSGSTSVRDLRENYGVTIWDEWERPDGTIGPGYGAQWRSWPDGRGGAVDQISRVIESIKRDPNGRRHIVNAWNAAEIDQMALPPCHYAFQFVVMDGRLNLHMIMRSTDVFLGLPFNMASYALLDHMVAEVTNLEPGELLISLTDAHLYQDHLALAEEQARRLPRPLPTLKLPPMREIGAFVDYDFELIGYDPHPAIKAEVAR